MPCVTTRGLARIHRLWRLQELDQALALAQKHLQELAEVTKVAAERVRAERVKDKHQVLMAQVKLARQKVKGSELELTAAETELKQVSERMFGGSVRHPKELSQLQAKSESLGREVERLTETVVTDLEALEKAEADLKKVEALVVKANKSLSVAEAEYDSKLRKLQKEIDELQARRSDVVAQIESTHLRIYERLLRTTQGRPVARVEGRLCTGCHVALPVGRQKRTDGALDVCDQCGRILWWD